MSKATVALIMACAFVGTPALAQTSGRTTDTGQTPDGWRGSLTPYLWVVGVQGNVARLPSGPGTDFDVTFNDITTHLQGAFVGKGEIGYDKFGLIGDLEYIKLNTSTNINVSHLPTVGAEVTLKTTLGTLAGYYRAYDSPKYTVDLLAGLAYTSGGVSLDLTGPLGNSIGGDIDHSWSAPIVGARGTWRINDKNSLTGMADVGGSSSNTLYQLYGSYNYQFNKLFTLSAGYRYYSIDFTTDRLKFNNLRLGGFLIAGTFNF